MITDKAISRLKTLEAKMRDQEAVLQDLVDKIKDSDYADEKERSIISYKYNKWHLTFPWKRKYPKM